MLFSTCKPGIKVKVTSFAQLHPGRNFVTPEVDTTKNSKGRELGAF